MSERQVMETAPEKPNVELRENPDIPVDDLSAKPSLPNAVSSKEAEHLEKVEFAGPLPWKSWTRTHIFGKYKPLASIFKGKRRKANGRIYYHQGLDVLCPRGTLLIAPGNGTVLRAGEWDKWGYGKALLVRVPTNQGTFYVLYAHLDKLLVGKGANVKKGSPIARSGRSGNAGHLPESEAHVHIEVRTKEKVGRGLEGRIDPLKYFTDVVPPQELRGKRN